MKKLFYLIKYEAKLRLKESFTYKINTITEILTYMMFYMGIYYSGSIGILSNFYKVDDGKGAMLLLIGYLIWQFSANALGWSSSSISSDATVGLLEVKMQSYFHLSTILFVDLIIELLKDVVILSLIHISEPTRH